jgi:hypothetical protein
VTITFLRVSAMKSWVVTMEFLSDFDVRIFSVAFFYFYHCGNVIRWCSTAHEARLCAAFSYFI